MSNLLSRQGGRLLQLGVALLILTSLWGFAIPAFASRHLALSTHTLSIFQCLIVMALGLIWPRLELGDTGARVAFWTFVYSTFAIIVAYALGAIWGAGAQTISMASEGARGSAAQETIILLAALTSAPTGLIGFGLVLWGLRNATRREGI